MMASFFNEAQYLIYGIIGNIFISLEYGILTGSGVFFFTVAIVGKRVNERV